MIKSSLTEASVEGITMIQTGENELKRVKIRRRLLHTMGVVCKQCESAVPVLFVPGGMETLRK